MPPKKPPPNRSCLVDSFRQGRRHYEHRLVNCGKQNCGNCNPPGKTSAPSHGPYWYLCAQRRGRWRRVYLGKNLDTTRYIDKDGFVDWDALARRRARNTPGEGTTTTIPGQRDMIDDGAALAEPKDPNP